MARHRCDEPSVVNLNADNRVHDYQASPLLMYGRTVYKQSPKTLQ